MNTKFLILLFISTLCPQLTSCELGHTTPLLVSHPHRSVRSLGEGTDHRIEIALEVFGKSVTLNLIPNQNLLHADYAHQHFDSNNHIVSQSNASAPCHYTGHVECVGCSDTHAFVSTCHGELRGLLRFNRTDHFIEPLFGPHDATHLVYTHVADEPTFSEVLHDNRGWLGKVTQSQLRSARAAAAISGRYYLESLVVLDGTMVSHHGSATESYALTIMNIVAGLLSLPSLGQPFFLVVSRLVTTSPGPDTFAWNTDRPRTFLPSFCAWQHDNNGTQGLPTHDLALLFTRRSLCRPGLRCSVVGRAYIGGLCAGRYSCLVVRDKGLMQAGTTVAHEMGHLFGSYHDENPEECRQFGLPTTSSIMSRVLTPATNHFEWSQCAKHSIADYLSRGGDACILNEPTSQIQRPVLLLTADEQCRSSLGSSARAVPSQTTCGALACHQTPGSNAWLILPMPMQDGTDCSVEGAAEGACLSGVCVARGERDCSGVPSGQARPDACGMCNGGGTSCHFVSGTVSKFLPNLSVHRLLSIPPEARDVTLIHLTPRPNVHLIATQAGGSQLLQSSRDLVIDGVVWHSATLSNGSDTFSTSGPISDSLDLEVLGGQTQVALYYSYVLPLVQEARLASEVAFHWVADSLCNPCSATCGTAVKECVAQCVDASEHPVSHLLCDKDTRPLDTSTPCPDLSPCPTYLWASSGWGLCSATCGRGHRTRNTFCLARTELSYQATHESNCVAGERPKSSLACWQPCLTTAPPTH